MLMRSSTSAPTAPRVDFERLLAATCKLPVDLAPIEWDGDVDDCAEPDLAPVDDPRVSGEGRRRRIRDRYIGARFPGAVSGAADLESPERVIKAARLYFEDGRAETGQELLDLAIEQHPHIEALWLAQLEILYLAYDAARFSERAKAFRQSHPASTHWAEVTRLGRALAPDDKFFGAKSGPRPNEHYGPWPHLPNWIQASWDLTGEVLASDFHRLLEREGVAVDGFVPRVIGKAA
ncbi:MAG TPA: hypothetical protein VKR38_17595 [Usitatibacter sp.]|nr:hypothetical protein [Usitatibacter sp.]